MRRKTSTFIIHGIALGSIAGCIVSCFDAFYVAQSLHQTPIVYPVSVFLVNCALWIGLGIFSGIMVAKIVKKGGNRSLNWYYGCLFLVPFLLLYGLLGRISFPIYSWMSYSQIRAYDNHLSFLFVSVLACYRLYSLRKEKMNADHRKQFFVLEITAAALIYHFCSNLDSKVSSLFMHESFYTIRPLIYSIGVVVIFVFYGTGCFLKNKLAHRGGRLKARLVVPMIVGCAVVVQAGAFATNYYNNRIVIPPSLTPMSKRETKRVIVLVLDTVRAKSMSLYGGRARTVNLEAFSHNALVFENCIAPSPWTVPSHASIFTGLHPIEHACHGNLESTRRDIFNFPEPNPLAEEALTLAEIFQQNGFTTIGIASNRLVFSPRLNLGQGFQIQDSPWGVGQIYQNSFKAPLHLFCALTGLWPQAILYYQTADVITKKALNTLEKTGGDPVFLFINFMDAHEPYYPPRSFAGKFLNTHFPVFERFKLFLCWHFFKRIAPRVWNVFQLTQYDSEIMWLDSQLGLFFERLKQMNIYDDSLIIVASDHGELLGEHGCYGHKTPMYDPVLRVPLLVKLPFNRKVGRVKARVTLSDIFPTVLSACNIPVPEYISASPLQATELEDKPVVSSFFNFSYGKHLTLHAEQYKYMDFQHHRPNELYDMDIDPLESNNQIDTLQDVQANMVNSLETWLQHSQSFFKSKKMNQEVSERYLEELRALGYLQ